ncbi:MarR family transcriptional regulator [Streptomyces sviceus ATCC 29083]|uniref:MarR family transcriptional regulator n=1 Tax=Streptomyces sviceus (strain ATCC 29083 / DSM 924 / JCM 4929 / NBRC 13980 / NCIMB 11184 / NRRL 5439 / UC 5370) TaxID=463191 RepID=B5HUQ6_STRX2|nr:MarR family transcriptional regulator [Streptomyces sviceus ATCC 29083]
MPPMASHSGPAGPVSPRNRPMPSHSFTHRDPLRKRACPHARNPHRDGHPSLRNGRTVRPPARDRGEPCSAPEIRHRVGGVRGPVRTPSISPPIPPHDRGGHRTRILQKPRHPGHNPTGTSRTGHPLGLPQGRTRDPRRGHRAGHGPPRPDQRHLRGRRTRQPHQAKHRSGTGGGAGEAARTALRPTGPVEVRHQLREAPTFRRAKLVGIITQRRVTGPSRH